MNLKRTVLAVASLAGCLTLGGVAMAAASDDPPLVGPIPEEALSEDGVNLDKVPEYVEVATGDDTQRGYVRKDEFFQEPALPSSPEEALTLNSQVKVLDVFDSTTTNRIGHWVSGAGFVPLGEDLEAVVQAVRDSESR
jgi:hypothetical protein